MFIGVETLDYSGKSVRGCFSSHINAYEEKQFPKVTYERTHSIQFNFPLLQVTAIDDPWKIVAKVSGNPELTW